MRRSLPPVASFAPSIALLPLLLLAASCSSNADSGAPGGDDSGAPPPPTDAGTDVGVDAPPPPHDAAAGDASDAAPVYPAFLPDIAQVVNTGGFVPKTPKLATVTWKGDPNVTTFEALGDALGGSAYWLATTGEYGVGQKMTSGSAYHVRIPQAPPATLDETALENFIVAQVNASPTSGWPAADGETIYLVYTAQSTVITANGVNDCPNGDGYHTEVSANATPHLIYGIVIQNCPIPQGTTLVDTSTETATHEIIEAATDAHTNSDTAWIGFDSKHYAWELWQAFQDELGDACEFYNDAYYKSTAPLPFAMQRTWSNKSATEGHNPCVPLPKEPYFNVTPFKPESISVHFTQGGAKTTTGFQIGVGKSRTIEFGFYSDAPAAPWDFNIVEGDGFTAPSPPRLTIQSPKSSGQNGEVAKVTVTVNSVGADTGILMTAISSRSSDATTHYMPVLIGAY